jgi:pimeloyl-ACP methyl ester carboxylesterase
MTADRFRSGVWDTPRHRTAWIEAGPTEGPLMIFVHGWPELGISWEHQLRHFAAAGWRCVAPDMRGYGASSVPTRVTDYSVREITADLLELHDALGAAPAIWVGHDWGCAPVWSTAAHHPERCRAVAALCVPYFARGATAENMIATVNRALYPMERHPAGQFDYWLYHREHAGPAAGALAADVRATFAAMYRRTSPDVVGRLSKYSDVRSRGGFFGPEQRAPVMARDETMLSAETFEAFVAAFEQTGFRGANAWYLNDADNAIFAREAPAFGRIDLPVLFVHAAWDTVCDTVHSDLAVPMREDCTALTEAVVEAGHMLMLEEPDAVNVALERWLDTLAASPRKDVAASVGA